MYVKNSNSNWIYYVAQIGHEIRTPLNSIVGFSDLLNKEVVGPLNLQQKKYLNNIQISANNLLEIINQILDWAKFSTGQNILNKKSFDLRNLILEVSSIYSMRQINENKFIVKYNPSIILNADEIRIKQVLINLIDNAFKFTHSGIIELKVIEKQEDLLIKICDTGCGMSQEIMNSIFEAFSTGTSIFDKDGHGSGLGLWISKEIISQHGGDISVESTIGEGSVFTIILPRGKDEII